MTINIGNPYSRLINTVGFDFIASDGLDHLMPVFLLFLFLTLLLLKPHADHTISVNFVSITNFPT